MLRRQEVLDECTLAFLIMTAEDEQGMASVKPGPTWFHEIGLFQARIGFENTSILEEEGCTGFSNIEELGYISFPPHHIEACFEQVRWTVQERLEAASRSSSRG